MGGEQSERATVRILYLPSHSDSEAYVGHPTNGLHITPETDILDASSFLESNRLATGSGVNSSLDRTPIGRDYQGVSSIVIGNRINTRHVYLPTSAPE